ncbi:uncharacterized protein LOC129591438 isoform X2 [Paramacrobiotus metropolitanus]|uniref:uncharacterized protein LOC129591438 isoform X2 n=2 Tax=Paramacrobiotus metropolitanus TaxID=2943436 RepID=UPI002445C4C3|nr:uncharacterized protein LOC129591438 isoform X2 [Paramacrobiotus metropolitanus]
MAAILPSPTDIFKNLLDHGLCRLIEPENATVTSALACLPWTSYIASIGIFVALTAIGIGYYLIVSARQYGCKLLIKDAKSFLKTTFKQADWRGLVVFGFSLASLYFSFFQSYFRDDTKLYHGWHHRTLPDTRYAIVVDAILNAVLLLLLVFKLIKTSKTCCGPCRGARKVTVFCQSPATDHRDECCKEPTCLRERIWSAIRDWEFFANVANFPLLCYELVIVLRWRAEPLAYWNVTATSLQFLRVFCFTWLCDEIIRIFRKLPIATGTVMRRITWIACSFLALAAWVQLVETLGDPWVSTYNGQKDLTFGKLVTFLYGKLVFLDLTSTTLETEIAKISVYVAQAVTLIFLSQIIPEMLKQLPKILRIHSFSAVRTRKDTKFILLLGSINSLAVEQFAERFRSTNPGENIVVLLDPNASDAAIEEMHTVAGKHKDRLTVITGSLFEKEDMENHVFDNCQCALFFANENASNFAEEDHCNFLRVNKVKQRHRNTRVIVKILMFENKEKFHHIPFWCRKSDQIICTAEIQFALLAQRYFAPNFPLLVNQWFGEEAGPTVRAVNLPNPTTISARSNMFSNNLGARSPTATASVNTPTQTNVNVESDDRATYNKIRRNQNSKKSSEEIELLSLHPDGPAPVSSNIPRPGLSDVINATYEDARIAFEPYGALFAVQQGGEYHLYPQKYLILQPGAKFFIITTSSSNELDRVARSKKWTVLADDRVPSSSAGQNVTGQPNNQESDAPDVTSRIRIPLSMDTECVEECGSQNVTCDITGQYWRYQLPKAKMPVKFPNELENMLPSTLEQHIVICVVSDRDPAPIGLVNFIKPLRAVHADPPVVVILAEADCLAKEWPALMTFPDILLVQGNPSKHDHLRAIKLEKSRLCIVVDASELPKKQSEKWKKSDAEAELIWPMLPKHFYRHVNAVLATADIAEYLKEFRNQMDTLPEEILTCIRGRSSQDLREPKKCHFGHFWSLVVCPIRGSSDGRIFLNNQQHPCCDIKSLNISFLHYEPSEE